MFYHTILTPDGNNWHISNISMHRLAGIQFNLNIPHKLHCIFLSNLVCEHGETNSGGEVLCLVSKLPDGEVELVADL